MSAASPNFDQDQRPSPAHVWGNMSTATSGLARAFVRACVAAWTPEPHTVAVATLSVSDCFVLRLDALLCFLVSTLPVPAVLSKPRGTVLSAIPLWRYYPALCATSTVVD